MPLCLRRWLGKMGICVSRRRQSPRGVALLRIAPDIISVLDYEHGFGHSELVTFSERDLDVHLETRSHPWNAVDGIK